MSVFLHRKTENGIEKVKVEADCVKKHIDSGYSFNRSGEVVVVDQSNDDLPTESASADDDKEIRAAARVAKIGNWHNKKIETLKKELGYVN